MNDLNAVKNALRCFSHVFIQSADERNCEKCKYDPCNCGLEVPADALSLLDALKPVKPRFDGDIWRCGECGHVVECLGTRGDYILINERYSYCPNCGKPVRWMNENGEPTNDNR